MSEGGGSAPKVLDRTHLATFTGGDPALEAELFALFEAQIEACIGRMSGAAPRDDQAWRDAAHTLKGAARGVGAMALGEACAAAETRPHDAGALEAVMKAAGAVRDAMRDARGGPGAG
ncbi:MAG: Hpt domain-containing protein [Oceanicaulis sp.]|nr:Hpt domain-containing protein [Oceanicaulis sp.]